MCEQFEPEVRELKMILDGQNEIFRSVKTLLVKLDEVVGRQERQLSLLTLISQGQPQAPPSDRQQVGNWLCQVVQWCGVKVLYTVSGKKGGTLG